MSRQLLALVMLTASTSLAAQTLKFIGVKVGDGVNEVRIVPWQLVEMPGYDPRKSQYLAFDPAEAAAVQDFASRIIDRGLSQKKVEDLDSVRLTYSSAVADKVEDVSMPMLTARQYLTTCKSFQSFSLGESETNRSVHYALVKFSCATANAPNEGALVGLQLRDAKVWSAYAGVSRPIYLNLKGGTPSNEARKN